MWVKHIRVDVEVNAMFEKTIDRIIKWSRRRNISIRLQWLITGISCGYCEHSTDCANAIVSACGFDKCTYRWLCMFTWPPCLKV